MKSSDTLSNKSNLSEALFVSLLINIHLVIMLLILSNFDTLLIMLVSLIDSCIILVLNSLLFIK